MHQEKIIYREKDMPLHGFLAYDDKQTGKRPCVLVAHAWRGQDDFARMKAAKLAELGYVGFAVDYYGEGKSVEKSVEAEALMLPLFADRALLVARLQAAVEVVKNHPMVDASKIGAIGFCFGGLAVLELFRSGADLSGAVTFHAVLGTKNGAVTAKKMPLSQNIRGSLLLLHGYDDPLVSSEDLQATQIELNAAKIDWQLHVYGQTSHAFSVPQANDKSHGLIYNPQADKRSWREMIDFFSEVFT